MDLGLKGKTALVTAASKGLGKASAHSLAREGCSVAICSRSEKTIQEAANEIGVSTGSQVRAMAADVSKASDIEELVSRAVKELGRIDILVINAGGPPPGNFLDLSPEDWEDAVQLTLMSVVRLCYAVIPRMIEQGGGSIVAIESVSVKQPVDNLILSNSIRMAAIGLLKSLANEYGKSGIRINSVNPAVTQTGRIDQLFESRSAKEGKTVAEIAEQIRSSIPLGRVGQPEEFGDVVAWLASPAAGFIHGHALMFDGGSVATPL